MVKFGRQFLLRLVLFDDSVLEIKDPFTIEFSCKRNVLAGVNTANFKIYNLAERTRSLMYKDKYDTINYKSIEFRAGYETDAPIIFKGEYRHCFSYRNGVNVITELDCFDGGTAIQNSTSSFTIAKGQTKGQIIQTLVNDLNNISSSNIGEFTGQTKRGQVMFGNTAELLRTETDNKFFIDNEVANCLQDDEVLQGDIRVITSETGLLSSPQRSDTQLNIKILFEPALFVAQLVELRSSVNPRFNAQYKVEGIEHSGTISQAVGGNCETLVSLKFGTEALRLLKGF